MELPLSVFYGFIAFALALPVLGYCFRMQIPMSLFFFISGTFLLLLFINTTTILVMEDNASRTTTYMTNGTGGTIIENKTPFDFSFEGPNYLLKFAMTFIAVMFIIGGVLIEDRLRR